MATSTMINVGANFNLSAFAQQLSATYQQKGFTVQVADMGNSVSIIFDKGTGGINMVLGLGLGVTANCVVTNGTLIINYTNAEWTGKIIGLAIGWLLCLIPFITAIIGCIQQSGLPKEIGNDAMMIASNLMNNPSVAAPVYQYNPAPSYQQPVQMGDAGNNPNAWNCSCGRIGNTGAFCSNCGSPRPR